MTTSSLTLGAKQARIHFGLRITLIVFFILVLSQTLGAFLSVLSFEKVFIGALISKYEIIGKDIARRIEQSLTFGKRLDRFVGMDRLAEPLFNKSKDLVEVFIAGSDGRIYFSAVKSEFIAIKGIADSSDGQGRILKGTYQAPTSFPVEDFVHWASKAAHTRFFDGKYYTLLPISPKYGSKGLLGLVFNNYVINQKKKEMIRRSIKMLALSVVATAIIIGLLIQLIFIRPARRQLGDVVKSDIAVNRVDPRSLHVPEEVQACVLKMDEFFALHQRVTQELTATLEQLTTQMREDPQALYEIRLMQKIIKGEKQ